MADIVGDLLRGVLGLMGIFVLVIVLLGQVAKWSRKAFRTYRTFVFGYGIALAILLPTLGVYTPLRPVFQYWLAVGLLGVFLEAGSVLGQRVQAGEGLEYGLGPGDWPHMQRCDADDDDD